MSHARHRAQPVSDSLSENKRSRHLARRRLREFLLRALAVALGSVHLSAGAEGLFADFDRIMIQYGPYAHHFSKNPDHNNTPNLVGIELENPSRFLVGASFFMNSFNQESGYIYFGKRWFFGQGGQGFYGKLTAGPLIGYRGEYEDKVPLNYNGLSPGVVPALGYQYRRANAQFIVFGASGFLITFGFDISQ